MVTSLGSTSFKVANFKAGALAGSITGKNFEDLRLDARAGADKITIDYMSNSGLGFIVLSAGKNVVRTGTEFVNDPESGQPIEQPRFAISDDRAADVVTVLGHDGNGDNVTLSDTDAADKGFTGIRVQLAGLPKIVVSDSIRTEGDALVISTRGGADTVTAAALTADRAALRIIGGFGDDTLKGSRFNDVIDSGKGSDKVTGDLGLDEFFDDSPSASNGVDDDGDGRIDEADENEIDTLIENLGARVETAGADVGLYNDKLVIGNLLNSTGSANFEVGKNAANELIDTGDRFAASATLENLKHIFEKADHNRRRGQQYIRSQRSRPQHPSRRHEVLGDRLARPGDPGQRRQ
jgi:Ca2+-binding RTX toxin-like protein